MTNSAVAVRGVQDPRVLSVPETVASTHRADECLELAELVGLHLDPWQAATVRAFLGTTADDKWAAFECALIVARQNGKGSVLEAIELAALFLWDDELILHSAHEFKTAQEAFRRVLRWIEGSAFLRKRVKPRGIRTSHGEEGIELLDGSRLRFVARSTGSGRGFTVDRVILDEAYNLPAESMAALLPVLSARPNPQLLYTSSAGLPQSDTLRRIRNRALSGGDGSLAYVEWSAADGADLDDRAGWLQANPAVGFRLSLDHIARERAALGEAEFGRERMGLWDDPSGVSVIPAETWASLIEPKAAPRDPVTFALDVSPDRAFGAVAVVGYGLTGFPVVEVVDSRPGTGWIVERVKDLAARWTMAGPVVIDSASAAASIAPDLIAAGVPVRLTTTREFVQACGTFYDAVMSANVVHRGQANLAVSVDNARKRDLGEAWAWQRRNSTVDLTPLVAGTLALWGHLRPEAPAEKAGARVSTTFYTFN